MAMAALSLAPYSRAMSGSTGIKMPKPTRSRNTVMNTAKSMFLSRDKVDLMTIYGASSVYRWESIPAELA
jgi:hypothetical protein